MSTATEPRDFIVDPELPVLDETTGREVFTVEYRGEDEINGRCLYRVEHDTELAAVRCIGSVILYANLTPVAYGPNIDRSKFAH